MTFMFEQGGRQQQVIASYNLNFNSLVCWNVQKTACIKNLITW